MLRRAVSSLSGFLGLALGTLLFLLLLVGFDVGVAAGGSFAASAYEFDFTKIIVLEPCSGPELTKFLSSRFFVPLVRDRDFRNFP